MSSETKGLLFDMLMCGGCRQCVVACKEKNGFDPVDDPEDIRELDAETYTCMWPEKVDGDEYNVRNMCRHCIDPSCASVCPVAALQKTELGPVIYDASKCIGCRYCMVACPFNIPRYEWNNAVPAVRKCSMCYDRILEGKIPACAEACPQEATIFGTRQELLQIARERIKECPDEYDPHIYGEEEVGGTSVLFLVPKRIAALGFSEELGTAPLPKLTWDVLSKIPGISISAGAALMAFWWITRRRNEVAIVEGVPTRPTTNGNGKDRSDGNE